MEAKFPSLTLDTQAAFSDVCQALCLRGGLPTHPPISIEGPALDCLRLVAPADTVAGVRSALSRGYSLTLCFAIPDVVATWVEAMRVAGFTHDSGFSPVPGPPLTMRKAKSVVELVAVGPEASHTELSSAQTSEFRLTKECLGYKVQVAGKDIAEATKPPYLGVQHGHRPTCWYRVDVDKKATAVYKM